MIYFLCGFSLKKLSSVLLRRLFLLYMTECVRKVNSFFICNGGIIYALTMMRNISLSVNSICADEPERQLFSFRLPNQRWFQPARGPFFLLILKNQSRYQMLYVMGGELVYHRIFLKQLVFQPCAVSYLYFWSSFGNWDVLENWTANQLSIQ